MAMYESLTENIIPLYKENSAHNDFRLNRTIPLIDGGFGIYSSARISENGCPLYSDFYRVGFCIRGSFHVDCGFETFILSQDSICFSFPKQLFALKNKSEDLFSYHIVFTQDFIEELISGAKMQYMFPFFHYSGTPFFKLSNKEARRIERLFIEIEMEIKNNHTDKSMAIKLFITQVLLNAKRSYIRQGFVVIPDGQKVGSLGVRFKKLVAKNFIGIRSISKYASMLGVSVKHLNKSIKEETGKPPGYFVNEVLMIEIKTLLKHSELTVSEIAYRLDFTDPSHLSKFFKRHKNITPSQFRNQ